MQTFVRRLARYKIFMILILSFAFSGDSFSLFCAITSASPTVSINPEIGSGTNVGWNTAIWGNPVSVPDGTRDYLHNSKVWLNGLGTFGTFQGRSLEIDSGAALFVRGGGALGGILKLNGGQFQNRSGINAEVHGQMEIVSESTILNINGSLDLRNSVSGSGNLLISSMSSPACRVVVRCPDQGYTGSFVLRNSGTDGVHHEVEFDADFSNARLVVQGGNSNRLSVCVLKYNASFLGISMPSAADLNQSVSLLPGTYSAASLIAAGVSPAVVQDQGGTLTVGLSGAGLRLDAMFKNHMVIQRGVSIPVFGTAAPNAEVAVEFGAQRKRAVANAEGIWQVFLDPMTASAESRMLVAQSAVGSQYSSISNVLVGDVWLCGGQSNMDTPLSGYPFVEPEFDGYTNSLLRLFNVNFDAAASLQDEVTGETVFSQSWLAAGSQSIPFFSAVGLCFGRRVQQEAGIPIGLIESAVGGSEIYPWLSSSALEAMGLSALQAPADRGLNPRQQPSVFYNGMIHALRRLPLKGVIWYQGESNADKPSCVRYQQIFETLITSWRDAFGQPDLPFYFVQIAPYGLLGWDRSGESWAWLREAQEKALSLTNTGRAVITDLGEYSNIHPEDKKPVGERLANLALNDMEVQAFPGFPKYENMEIQNGRIRMTFSNVNTGLKTGRVAMNNQKGLAPGTDPQAFVVEADKLSGFTICGSDQKFVYADARVINTNSVEVWSDTIENPVAVRYGWTNFPLCNLVNSEDIPASPFRTDDFAMPVFKAPFLESGPADGTPGGAVAGTVMEKPDESLLQPETIEGRAALRMSYVSNVTRMAYFHAGDSTLRNGNCLNQFIAVDYLDDGPGAIEIKVDAVSGAWKSVGLIEMKGSGQWRRAVVELDDAWFSGRCNGADFRLDAVGRDVYIADVSTIPGNAEGASQ